MKMEMGIPARGVVFLSDFLSIRTRPARNMKNRAGKEKWASGSPLLSSF
jgi:hypothetical protein